MYLCEFDNQPFTKYEDYEKHRNENYRDERIILMYSVSYEERVFKVEEQEKSK